MTGVQTCALPISAQEARNLQSEIFALLVQVADMSRSKTSAEPDVVQISMDGGGFK